MAGLKSPECASPEEDAARSPPGTFFRFSRFAKDSTLTSAAWLLSQMWSSTASQGLDSAQMKFVEASRSLDELPDASSTVEDWDVVPVAPCILRQGDDDVAVQEAEVAGNSKQDDDLADAPKIEDDDYSATQLHAIQQNEDRAEFMRNDIIIAVMGVTGAGKSTFISLLSEQDIEIGHGQKSCTTNVGVYHFTLGDVRIWLIDTPGFDDTNLSDTEVLEEIAYWLARAYTRHMQLAGIIYLHRITDVRMQGSALRNLRLFKELCGRDELRSVILATTHWTHGEGNSVSGEVGRARVKELETTKEFWGGMIERGSKVEKHDGSKASALRIVSNLVSRHESVTLKIQRQLVDEERSLLETAAGQELQREMVEERRRAEETLKKLKLDMEFALEEKDKEWQEAIKRDRADLQARIDQRTKEMEALKVNLTRLEAEKDEQFHKMERKWKKERVVWEARLHKAIVSKRNPGDALIGSATAHVSDRPNQDIPWRREWEIENRQENKVPGRPERIALTIHETPSRYQTSSGVEPEVRMRHKASPRHVVPTIHGREILVGRQVSSRHEVPRRRSEQEFQRIEPERPTPYEAEMPTRLDSDTSVRLGAVDARERDLLRLRELLARGPAAKARRENDQSREERENLVARRETRARQEQREILARYEAEAEYEAQLSQDLEVLARHEAQVSRDRQLLAWHEVEERRDRQLLARHEVEESRDRQLFARDEAQERRDRQLLAREEAQERRDR